MTFSETQSKRRRQIAALPRECDRFDPARQMAAQGALGPQDPTACGAHGGLT